jgi:hypothetical protein
MLLTSGATVTNAGATKTLEGWRVALGEQVTAWYAIEVDR